MPRSLSSFLNTTVKWSCVAIRGGGEEGGGGAQVGGFSRPRLLSATTRPCCLSPNTAAEDALCYVVTDFIFNDEIFRLRFIVVAYSISHRFIVYRCPISPCVRGDTTPPRCSVRLTPSNQIHFQNGMALNVKFQDDDQTKTSPTIITTRPESLQKSLNK